MLIRTKHFGEIDLDENKVITFDKGIFGFEEYKKYAILFNSENKQPGISWLQSIDDPALSLPMINPFLVIPDYNPSVNENYISDIGEITEESTIVYTTLTVPSDITQMTTNLKAPIIINVDLRKGCQAVADNDDYVIKYKVYDYLKKKKE